MVCFFAFQRGAHVDFLLQSLVTFFTQKTKITAETKLCRKLFFVMKKK
jgi:hypothetical protein